MRSCSGANPSSSNSSRVKSDGAITSCACSRASCSPRRWNATPRRVVARQADERDVVDRDDERAAANGWDREAGSVDDVGLHPQRRAPKPVPGLVAQAAARPSEVDVGNGLRQPTGPRTRGEGGELDPRGAEGGGSSPARSDRSLPAPAAGAGRCAARLSRRVSHGPARRRYSAARPCAVSSHE